MMLGARTGRAQLGAPARPFVSVLRCSPCSFQNGHIRTSTAVCRAEQYTGWPRARLTDELRRRYLPVTGSKDILVSRLLEDDTLCSQTTLGDKAGPVNTIASSIRDRGVLPPFSKVTKVQIIAELRRRGATSSAKTKIELYDALQEFLQLATSGDGVPTRDTQLTSSAQRSDSDASVRNESFLEAVTTLSDPGYNPDGETAEQLRCMLQALQLPCKGRKAELLGRLNAYRAELKTRSAEVHPSTVIPAALPDTGHSSSVTGNVRPQARAPSYATHGHRHIGNSTLAHITCS